MILSRNCLFFIPVNIGVLLITAFGLLNKLSGFYGLIALDYSDAIVVCVHVYSLLALGAFATGLYGISKERYSLIQWYIMFYWFDFVVSTITTVYFAIQWFVYTDHSLAELENDPEGKKQHDDSFKAESIVSIVLLCLFRLIHLYFAYVLTSYYISLGQAQYTKLRAAVDEELNPPGFNEDENDEKDQ